MITAEQVIRELHSATCPVCHREKVKKTAFCAKCYEVLPPHMAAKLRLLRIGAGKEEAYDEAKRCIVQRRLTAKDVGAGRHTSRLR